MITVGYRYNEKSKSAFNTFEGFHAIIEFNEKENRYNMSMGAVSANSSEASVIQTKIRDFYSDHKNNIIKAEYRNKSVHVSLKMTIDSDIDKSELKDLARFVIELCKTKKISPICKVCSRQRKTGLYVVGRSLTPICDTCVTRKRRQYEHRKNIFIKKKQNMLTGLIGAVFGAIFGAAIYVFLYQLLPSYGIAGGIILILAFVGFVVTGKRATKKSAVICVIISVITLLMSEYAAIVANMAILIEKAGGGIALSEAISATNAGFSDMSYTSSFLMDIGIGTAVMIVIGVIYFLKRKYTRPLKISKNVL